MKFQYIDKYIFVQKFLTSMSLGATGLSFAAKSLYLSAFIFASLETFGTFACYMNPVILAVFVIDGRINLLKGS